MLFRRLYYLVKPYLPWRLRMGVRGWLARRKREAVKDVWPIDESAGRAPEGWPGWPEGKKFAFVITHDVEGPDGLEKCRRLAELEMELGFRSSFNFIPEGGYTVPPDLRDWLKGHGFEVGIHDLQHDGKLFDSRRGFAAKAQRINYYLREWGAVGFRAGFMLRNLDWLHAFDICYDASTFDTDPFEPQSDGMGTIFPFFIARSDEKVGRVAVPAVAAREGRVPNAPSDPSRRIAENPPYPLPEGGPAPEAPEPHSRSKMEDGKGGTPSSIVHRPSSIGELDVPGASSRSGYVELPYTLPQDSTLFFLLHEKTPGIWLRKLDWIAAHGGMALINVHPDYLRFDGEKPSARTFSVSLYSELLRCASQKYAGQFWNPRPSELAGWYKGLPQVRRGPAVAPSAVGRHEQQPAGGTTGLRGKRAAVLLYSTYPADPRPRRAAQALIEAGMEVDLHCLSGHETDLARELVDGVRVFRMPMKHRRESDWTYFRQYGLFFVSSFWFLTRHGLRRRYDLVHVHNMPDFLVFAALVPKLLGARVILDLHDPMPELAMGIYLLDGDAWKIRLLRRLERWSIGFANLALTPNVSFKNLFVARSCRPEKMQIVMNTPEEGIFHAESLADEPPLPGGRNTFRIMHHGLIAHRHGVDLLVEAVARVRATIPGVQLDIYGSHTPFLDTVLEVARRLDVAEIVHYHGAKPQTEIAEAIRQCALGVVPNRRSPFTETNFPTRLFEYLAMHRPVIAPSTQGIRDYFGDGQMLFFEPGDVTDLAARILWVWEHPAESREIARNGLEVYRQHLWSQEKTHFVNLVSRLCART